MDTYSLLLLGIFIISLIILFFLYYKLRTLIRKQIDDQLKSIIPIKVIRERVGIIIKWTK